MFVMLQWSVKGPIFQPISALYFSSQTPAEQQNTIYYPQMSTDLYPLHIQPSVYCLQLKSLFYFFYFLFFQPPHERKHQFCGFCVTQDLLNFSRFNTSTPSPDPASEQEAAGALQQHHGGAAAALHSGAGGQVVPHVVPRRQGPRGHAALGGQANSHRRGQDQLLLLLCGKIALLRCHTVNTFCFRVELKTSVSEFKY